jgi:hypothetical protein
MEANLDDISMSDNNGGLANDGFLAIGAPPKKRHIFVGLMNGDAYNFLDKPDVKEEKMYCVFHGRFGMLIVGQCKQRETGGPI